MKAILYVLLAMPLLMNAHFARAQESPGGVHFEPVNERGEFIDHQIIADPLAPLYLREARTARPQSVSSVIVDHGPSAKRINLVFIGDGYTKAQLSSYAGDVKNVVRQLFAEEPYRSYASYFNVHRVDVVSAESGVSQDPQGANKQTALDMTYWCGGLERLLCVNEEKALAEASNAPRVDQILALANSERYGGAGYWNSKIATMAARSSYALELAIHEMGHALAGLSDEYDVAGSDCNNGANVSSRDASEMMSARQKWFRWLDVPGISAFRGACYSATKFFRPTENSKMRQLGQPFYEVNLEAHIIAFYKMVRPIDDATAEGEVGASEKIFVRPLAPTDHKLDVAWFVDGHALSHSRGHELELGALGLPAGRHTIKVKVVDPTPQVRDERARAKYMTEERSWTVTIGKR